MNKLVDFLKKHYYLSTALLLFFSGPTFDVWICKGFPLVAWFSMIPLFYYMKKETLKNAYIGAFITGLLGAFINYEWIGNFAGKQAGGYTTIVVLLVAFMAVFFAGRFFLAEVIARSFPGLRILVYPLIWVFIDWIQSIGYLAFPWSNIGYSQYPMTSLVQSVSVIGILGLNFVMILWQALLVEAVIQVREKKIPPGELLRLTAVKGLIFLFTAIIIMTSWGFALLRTNDRPIKKDLRVTVIQSCISPWENWRRNRFRYLRELKKITEISLFEEPEFVIWSESATLETISFSYARNSLNEFQKELLEYVRYMGRPLITGEIGIEKGPGPFARYYPQNNAVLINKEGEVVKTYAKIHLVPFGEWFPYENIPFLGKRIKKITSAYGGSSFIPGQKPVLFDLKERKFGVLVCYEGIFYRLCRQYRSLGAEYLINITNDGWTDKYRGHMQHFAASIFRAIENGVWYIRAGNTGYTTIIDPYGRIRESMPILKKGYIAGNLDFSFNHSTFYTASGDALQYLLVGAAFFLIGAWLVRLMLLKKKEKGEQKS